MGGDYVPPVEGHFCGESCANRWRGMLFGMSNRAGWNGKDPNDNMHLWKLWDELAIEKCKMYGWWNRSNPVKVFDEHSQHLSETVLATAYVNPGNVMLVAIASWDATNTTISLSFDWKSIGLERERASVTVPHIPSFNRHNRTLILRSNDDNQDINRDEGRVSLIVPAYEGLLLVIK